MICKECGHKLPDDSLYCSKCGTRVRANDEEEFLALNRRKRNYIAEKQRERSYSAYANVAADSAWRLAVLLYNENIHATGSKKILSKGYCPPDARFVIEMEAECIMKSLDAIHYKAMIERSKIA